MKRQEKRPRGGSRMTGPIDGDERRCDEVGEMGFRGRRTSEEQLVVVRETAENAKPRPCVSFN
jgi:hypothetical protein